MSEHITQITGDTGEPLTVTVRYTYHRATRGARDSLGGVRGAGAPLEPDEPEYVEIESVKDANGREIEITRETERALEAEILQSIEQAREAALEDRYEARRDRERWP